MHKDKGLVITQSLSSLLFKKEHLFHWEHGEIGQCNMDRTRLEPQNQGCNDSDESSAFDIIIHLSILIM